MQRLWKGHSHLQGTLCRRTGISWPRFSITFVGQTVTASNNHTTSTIIRCNSFSWNGGLQQNSFCPPGCKIIAHEKPSKRRIWAPHVQHGYSLGPAMHHYRCQNVYISATASERIVDTLECFPSQFTNATIVFHRHIDHGRQWHDQCITNPRPDVAFAHVGDATIAALTQLAEIFKNKFQKLKSPELSPSPIKANENKRPPALTQPILSSPQQHRYQTMSQKTTNTENESNTPLLPRVISQVGGQAPRWSPQEWSLTELWAHNWLGRESILRHVFEVGLQKQNMWHLYAWLRVQCAQQIPTGLPKTSATYTIPICYASVWSKNQIYNAIW
jgi:hypothetical protein